MSTIQDVANFRKFGKKEDQTSVYAQQKEVKALRYPWLPPAASKFPPHLINIYTMLKNNGELRRITAYSIINILRSKEIINENDKTYIKFNFNKISVFINGLAKEYLYTEEFVITALVAAIHSMNEYMSMVVNNFTFVEQSKTADKVVNMEFVNALVSANRSTLVYDNVSDEIRTGEVEQ